MQLRFGTSTTLNPYCLVITVLKVIDFNPQVIVFASGIGLKGLSDKVFLQHTFEYIHL